MRNMKLLSSQSQNRQQLPIFYSQNLKSSRKLINSNSSKIHTENCTENCTENSTTMNTCSFWNKVFLSHKAQKLVINDPTLILCSVYISGTKGLNYIVVMLTLFPFYPWWHCSNLYYLYWSQKIFYNIRHLGNLSVYIVLAFAEIIYFVLSLS